MDYRAQGYAFLRGHGLEIGALHHPAILPDQCTVDYFDAITRAQAQLLFPEVSAEQIVDPVYLGDLDKGGLSQFEDEQFDFVILSHVIEHVANPIDVIKHLFRITKTGGHLVIACPDKRYTFDKDREITSFLHLAVEYHQGVDAVSDEHYLDFLAGVHPQLLSLPVDEVAYHVGVVRSRREHAHVWDSETFRAFIVTTISMLEENATCVYESLGEENRLEYFSVWRKEAKSSLNMARFANDPGNLREQRSLADLEAVVLEKEDQLAALRTTVLEQVQCLADLEAVVFEKEDQLAALRTTVLEQAQYSSRLEIAIAQKNQHIFQLEALLQQMMSGRVMKLLQWVKQLRP
jgi:SAM-dependent methyltransferase